MNAEEAGMYFGARLDNSELKADAQEASSILAGVGREAEEQSASIKQLLSDVPTVNIDVVTNASTALDGIDAAFAEIDRVVDTNKSAIQQLEKEYDRLSKAMSEAYKQGNDKEYNRLKQQAQAVRQNITLRKQINREAANTADELAKVEKQLQKETKEVKENAEQHVSLRQRLREVKLELVEMEAAGERGTAKYRELQEEAARLTDAWGDAQAQATILANDQRGFQGVISGLQGVAGAASVATGIMGLYGSENEHLQQIMLKVQSLMAITMGLQQVSNTLNKDSAFSLVTLNGLKQLWNKLMGESSEALQEENTATAENTAEKEANAAATTADTTAEVANKAATAAGTTATNAATGAEVANTAATKAHTTATVAQTVATKAASLALKGLKAALISTGIGALIVLVGELVGWLVSLFDTVDEGAEKEKALNEVMEKGAEAYAKAQGEISGYITKIEHFNGTKEQEKNLVKELNNKYGEALGYYDSLAQWKEVLKEKGEIYCQVLLKEAEAQAILSKYTEAYIALQEVRNTKASEFGNIFTTKAGDEQRKRNAIADAQKTADYWLKAYQDKMQEAQSISFDFNIGGHTDPTKVSPTSGGKGKTFDPAKAALETKKAIEEYKKAVSKYVKDANDELNALIISSQEQGLVRELNSIRQSTRKQLEAWNEQLRQLAEARKAAAKAQYMNTKGATEVGWANSADGKKSIEDWIAVIKAETPQVIAEFDRVWQQITQNGDAAIQAAQQKYTDALIDEFGTAAQKEEKLMREWSKKIAFLPAEFLPQALEQMEQEFAKLDSDRFKAGIDWESVFGNLSEQAVPVLERTLAKVKQYFEENKKSMSTQEIKDYQEAIANMEQEIVSRNPFSAMLKSIHDIKTSKAEMVAALAEIKLAQEELTAAVRERNAAQLKYNEILERVESGELTKQSEEYIEAEKRLQAAIARKSKATEDAEKADTRYNKALNKNTQAYKQFASSLRSVGDVVGDVGRNAEKLAAIFDSDVAKSIGKAVTFMDEAIEASSTIINAIGDLGKNVAQGVETTVEATSQGAKAAATTGAAAISTIEKASAILAIISAAIQLATAVASLFNDDDSKQEEIEHLQERIDQLQWELDNRDIIRLQERNGKAIDIMNKAIDETRKSLAEEYKQLGEINNMWERIRVAASLNETLMRESAERIATAYANMGYTADKALGAAKFNDARAQLENIAQQQLLIQEQIDTERDKKDSDSGQIADWEQKIEELGAEALQIINELVEDIIGGTSTDIAKQLADAFFEAFEAGEDAAEAWGKKVDAIVADVLKRMMVSKFLEEPLGEIFDKYKAKWFKDGNFAGIDAVVASMEEFRTDLNSTYGSFADVMEAIPEDLRSLLMNTESTREGAEKGIAQASQDSVDELNGRATAIQGHTYSIANDTRLLLGVANSILESVLNIETSTDGLTGKVDALQSDIKALREDVSDIVTKGIKLK